MVSNRVKIRWYNNQSKQQATSMDRLVLANPNPQFSRECLHNANLKTWLTSMSMSECPSSLPPANSFLELPSPAFRRRIEAADRRSKKVPVKSRDAMVDRSFFGNWHVETCVFPLFSTRGWLVMRVSVVSMSESQCWTASLTLHRPPSREKETSSIERDLEQETKNPRSMTDAISRQKELQCR